MYMYMYPPCRVHRTSISKELGPLFQALVYPKYSKLEVTDPRLWYWTIFTQSVKCMGLKSLNFSILYRGHTVFKTKRKNIDQYITFHFLLNLLWIVQVSIELLSSQWKPPSTVVKTPTLKNSHFGKRPYAWNQIRTTFSGPSVSKILKVGSHGPQVMILDHFYTIRQMYGPQIFVFQKIQDIHMMINSSAHEFLNI